MGKSILDDIEGIGDLLGELGDAFSDQEEQPPTSPEPKPRKKREAAIERRVSMAAGMSGNSATQVAPVQLLEYRNSVAPSTSLCDELQRRGGKRGAHLAPQSRA